MARLSPLHVAITSLVLAVGVALVDTHAQSPVTHSVAGRRVAEGQPVAVLKTPDLAVAPGEAIFFDATESVVSDTAVVEWSWPDGAFKVVDGGGLTAIAKAPKVAGLFTVTLSIHDYTTSQVGGQPQTVTPCGSTRSVTVTVGELSQPPTKPVDTKPDDSTSPMPDGSAPVKVDGFRALLLYEAGKGMPDSYASPEVAAYLNAKCVKGENGTTPDWRRWDDEIDPIGDFSIWGAYRAAAPKSIDEHKQGFVVVGNGKTGFAGPAPASDADLLNLLKKYGG